MNNFQCSMIYWLTIVVLFNVQFFSQSIQCDPTLTNKTSAVSSNIDGSGDGGKPATTESPTKDCSLRSSSCEYCVENYHCYYCYVTKKCENYPFDILKPMPDCGDSMSDLSWRTCKFSANTLLIVFGSLFGLIALIVVVLCVWCCCVKKCVSAYNEKQSVRWDRKRLEMVNKQEERVREREQFRDQIRAKYGLNSGPNYQKF